MSVTTSATSPLSHTSARPRTTHTPLARPAIPGSVAHAVPPLMNSGRGRTANSSTKSTEVRSSSPNYFGFQTQASGLPVSTYNGDSGQHTRSNWSPPSSTIRSTAAASPSVIPLDQNPDYAAFRRQSEGLNRAFSLSGFSAFSQNVSPTNTTTLPDEGKWPSGNEKTGTPVRARGENSENKIKSPTRPGPFVLDTNAAGLGRSPKRHLSSDSTNFPDEARRASPATHGPTESILANVETTSSPESELQPPLFAPNQPTFALSSTQRSSSIQRSATVPAPSNAETCLIPPQCLVALIEDRANDVLLLDLRVSTQYAKSRIRDALSLCIPTTLMKRPSFTVEKLAETFKSNEQRRKFETWRSSKFIVVYDSNATQLKDAAICLNTIKKFEVEGYAGTTYILRGGFADFCSLFPRFIDKTSASAPNGPPKLTMPGQNEPLPVIGGCPMPATQQPVNPFFGNIRQNMDLVGGVGQLDLKKPSNMTKTIASGLPAWLRKAADDADHGKAVSDKFLHIEKREQKRMQDALSGGVSYGTPSSSETPAGVKIAGIEKGSKNRYNNIWPFEHTRVKLDHVGSGECDYVNANHISSSLSHKRYIATQGPIPATFADFWNVIWQQDIRVIVMLTAEKEGNQVKAHNYWSDTHYGPFTLSLLSERRATLDPIKIARHRARTPQEKERKSFDNHGRPAAYYDGKHRPATEEAKPDIVRTDSKSDSVSTMNIGLSKDEPFVTVRRFTISHTNEPFSPIREVTHLQYASWPDFGAPAHPAHLLGLVEQTDAVVRSLSHVKINEPVPEDCRQVLVHCSAGCGRTGTFCTVDTVIDSLRRQRKARRTSAGPVRANRESTPMDVDVGSPTPAPPNHGRSDAQKRSDISSGGKDNPFFGSKHADPAIPRKAQVEPALSCMEGEQRRRNLDGAWLLDDKIDLIEKAVEDFRHQRLSMVQNLRQYVLCYESILEWLMDEAREGGGESHRPTAQHGRRVQG